jgi:transposase
MKNKYIIRSRISEAKFREVLKMFVLDVDATKTAQITNLNRNTINKIFNGIRQRVLLDFNVSGAKFSGEIELDESYFGAKRVRGKRGRGAAGKTPVFGMKKREGGVYVEIVKNCSKDELMPIIQGKILENSTIHTDGWRAYDGLILNGYDHYRVFHSHNEFARGKCHVNGIEAFWSYCKRRLSKFNGMDSEKFILHLKECEFRYSNRDCDLYQILLKMIRKNPLN